MFVSRGGFFDQHLKDVCLITEQFQAARGCKLEKQLLSYGPSGNLLLEVSWSSWKQLIADCRNGPEPYTANIASPCQPACL